MLFNKYEIRFHKPLLWRTLAAFLDLFGNSEIKPISKPKKILVIRKDEIGDLALSTPMYENMRKRFPKAEISVLAGKPASQIIENNPYIDNIIESRTVRFSKLGFISDYIKLIKRIRNEKYDLAIDPKGSILNILMMYLAGIKQRASYWNVSGGRCLLTHPVTYEKQMHESDAGLYILDKIGIKTKRMLPKLYPSKEEIKEGNAISSGLPKGYCIVYMTPSSKYKSWPVQNWKDLFSKFPDVPFVILAREPEREVLEINFNDIKNVQVVCIKSLNIIYTVLKNSKAVIAVDGGIMHLSWISNPRTIALLGQNDIILWRNLRGKTITHMPESEQGINRKPLKMNVMNKYMQQITVEEVSKALEEYIR